MRLLIALACLAVLAGCVAPAEPTYQTFVDQVPPCPESGLLSLTLVAENDREVAWAAAAFRSQGWDGAPDIAWRDGDYIVTDTCGQREAVASYTLPDKPLPREESPAASRIVGLILMVAGPLRGPHRVRGGREQPPKGADPSRSVSGCSRLPSSLPAGESVSWWLWALAIFAVAVTALWSYALIRVAARSDRRLGRDP